MGANFQTEHFPVTDKEQIKQKYVEYISAREFEQGHDPYSGYLSTLGHNIVFTTQEFDDILAANNWIAENHEKWEPPLAVKVPDGWLIGGWCPS